MERCVDKLNRSFKSNITLLYLDVPEKEGERKNELTYISSNLVAGTHTFAPYSWTHLRANIFAAEFATPLRSIWGNDCFLKLACPPEARLLPAKTPHWRDVVYVNPKELTGYRCFNKDPFKVLHFDDEMLEVKWERWSTERFTRIPSKDFPVWERK